MKHQQKYTHRYRHFTMFNSNYFKHSNESNKKKKKQYFMTKTMFDLAIDREYKQKMKERMSNVGYCFLVHFQSFYFYFFFVSRFLVR